MNSSINSATGSDGPHIHAIAAKRLSAVELCCGNWHWCFGHRLSLIEHELMEMSMKRSLFAFLVSPILMMVSLAVVAVLGMGRSNGGDLAAVFIIMGIPISYLSGIFIGIPLAILFVRRRWISRAHFIFIGAISAVPYASLFFFQSMPNGIFSAVGIFMLLCCVGSITATVFWYVGVKANSRFEHLSSTSAANTVQD